MVIKLIPVRFILLVCSFFVFTFYPALDAQNVRGFYVNDFKNIIGDTAKEDELLQFAQKHNFNYLLLYNLYFIHGDLFDITKESTATPLANFIHKAKTIYGIEELGAVGETSQSFITIDAYNELFKNDPSRRFDIYNLEFEFWNVDLAEGYYCDAYLQESGYDCTTEDAFNFYYKELQKITTLAHANGVKAESYIGLPTAEQSQKIGELVDRLLVHFYRWSDVYVNGNSIYNYHEYRLKDLSPSNGLLEILPIFSARPLSMGPWLENHPIEQAYETFMYGQMGFMNDEGTWKDHIDIRGYQWYRYTDLLEYVEGKTIDNTITITLYPNPANQVINFEFTNPGFTKVSLMDISGRVGSRNTIPDDNHGTLDISHLKSGVYFLVFYINDEKVIRTFFIDRL